MQNISFPSYHEGQWKGWKRDAEYFVYQLCSLENEVSNSIPSNNVHSDTFTLFGFCQRLINQHCILYFIIIDNCSIMTYDKKSSQLMMY